MPTVRRRAGRVLAVNPEGCLLLLRGEDPARPEAGRWWFTIGGGCEDGESSATAARREAFEEAGLVLGADLGPVVARRTVRFEFDGVRYEQAEDFYFVQVPTQAVRTDGWTDVEQRVLSGYRWWSRSDLEDTTETVYPGGLADLLTTLLADDE